MKYSPKHHTERRGSVIPLVAVSSTVLLGFTALSVDVGSLYTARAEAQRTADAAALAAAMALLDQEAYQGSANYTDEMSAARTQAVAYASQNYIRGFQPIVEPNEANAPDGDVVVGYLYNPDNLSEPLTTNNPALVNSVQIRVRMNEQRAGQIPTFFGALFGRDGVDLSATATATYKDGCIGFSIPANSSQNAQLLPFALQVDTWKSYLAGTTNCGDSYSYDSDTGQVSGGSDAVVELNLYPGAGATQLPPGNLGTVDIGSSNNSTNDIKRQILYGISADDLNREPFWGEVKLGANGTLILNGDTGLSAGFKAELEAIKGQPRVIPLFTNTTGGNGNNTDYVIVGFAGIRIVNVRLTGSMNSKELRIQPANVVDSTVIAGEGKGPSYFVYQPVRLTR